MKKIRKNLPFRNINQVKEIYKEKYFQVEAENSKEDVLEDMAVSSISSLNKKI
jgi:hypothetical protein